MEWPNSILCCLSEKGFFFSFTDHLIQIVGSMYNRYISSTLFQEDDDAQDPDKKQNSSFPAKCIGNFPGTDQKVRTKS